MFWMIAALLVLAGGIAFGVAVGVHHVTSTSPTTVACHTTNPYLNAINHC